LGAVVARRDRRCSGPRAAEQEGGELREWYEGFLVPTFYLHKLSGDELVEVREKALKGDLYAAARLAIDAELERLKRMAEAGFPDAPRIFDRFVDALGELSGAWPGC